MHHAKGPINNFERIMALPEDEKAELVNGVIIYSMAPASIEHSRTCGALTTKITAYAESKEKGPDDPDSWVVVPEAWTYYDHNNVFVHDIAAYLQKELPATSERGPIKTRPVWVCEVLLPSNWINDTEYKRVILEKYLVPFYWLVDPIRKAIQVFELKKHDVHYQIVKVVYDGDGVVKLPPFHDLELDLRRVFK